MFGCTSATAAGSGARTTHIEMAETKNETASIRIVIGAVKAAQAIQLTSATEAREVGVLFPSVN